MRATDDDLSALEQAAAKATRVRLKRAEPSMSSLETGEVIIPADELEALRARTRTAEAERDQAERYLETERRQIKAVDDVLGFPDGEGHGRIELLRALQREVDELREALMRMRAVGIRAMDALESDSEVDARREAFGLIQEQFEGVASTEHAEAEALIPVLRAALTTPASGPARREP